jgi:hypothetical protein
VRGEGQVTNGILIYRSGKYHLNLLIDAAHSPKDLDRKIVSTSAFFLGQGYG